MAKHIEPMPLCQPGEVGNYFPDKHRSLIWPAVALRLFGYRKLILASGCAPAPVMFLAQNVYIRYRVFEKLCPFGECNYGTHFTTFLILLLGHREPLQHLSI